MLESLKKIFKRSEESLPESVSKEELYLLCGLMIEAAQTDGKIDQKEIDSISNSLVEVFQENKMDVEAVLKNCLNELNEAKSLHSFTSKLNKMFSNEKKILLIETLWGIVLADGELHEFESNLIRRLAGLLYISDVSCGNAKKRVLEKLKNINEIKTD